MKVLVLGATGFVGSRVVEVLAKHRDVEVIAGIRPGSERRVPAGVPVRLLAADDRTSLYAAIEGVTHVVNCVMAAPQTMLKGVDLLVEVALQRNLRRLVHLSSIAVHGDIEGDLDEASPLGEHLNPYARAKAEAETLLRRGMDQGVPAVILRPGLIYGPGSEAWTLRIARLLRQGRLGDLGAAGDGYANLIHVEEVARAILAALLVHEAQCQTFSLAPALPPRWNDYLRQFGRHLGLPMIPRIPGWRWRAETKLLAVPLRLAELALPRLGLPRDRVPPPVTPSLAHVMQQQVRFSPVRADMVLRLHRLPWLSGVAQTAETLRGAE